VQGACRTMERLCIKSFALISVGLTTTDFVSGHGYLKKPLSRNLYAYREGLWYGNEVGVPLKDESFMGLNRKKAEGICGISETKHVDYDAWLDSTHNPMPWIAQKIYNQGDVIDVTAYITANHFGHMEMYACANGRTSNEDCLLANSLENVTPGVLKDPTFPGRAFFSSASGEFDFKFQLPAHMCGPEVLLQWVYVTSNSCSPPGYEALAEELKELQGSFGILPACGPYDSTGDKLPERFWNCAEVQILCEGDHEPSDMDDVNEDGKEVEGEKDHSGCGHHDHGDHDDHDDHDDDHGHHPTEPSTPKPDHDHHPTEPSTPKPDHDHPTEPSTPKPDHGHHPSDPSTPETDDDKCCRPTASCPVGQELHCYKADSEEMCKAFTSWCNYVSCTSDCSRQCEPKSDEIHPAYASVCRGLGNDEVACASYYAYCKMSDCI